MCAMPSSLGCHEKTSTIFGVEEETTDGRLRFETENSARRPKHKTKLHQRRQGKATMQTEMVEPRGNTDNGRDASPSASTQHDCIYMWCREFVGPSPSLLLLQHTFRRQACDATQTHGPAAGGWPRCEDQLHRGAPLCLVELLACACTTRHNNTKNKSESTRKPLEKGIRGR